MNSTMMVSKIMPTGHTTKEQLEQKKTAYMSDDVTLNIGRIESAIAKIQSHLQDNESLISPYDSHELPDISIRDFVERLIDYAPMSIYGFVLCIAYVDISCQRLYIHASRHNIHRLILTGWLLANKILEDDVYANSYIANIGGVTLYELNSLEIHMLKTLDYRLEIGDKVLQKYISILGAR